MTSDDAIAWGDDERHAPPDQESDGDIASSSAREDAHSVLRRFGEPTRVVAVATMVIAIGLIPWIVGLGFTLPPRYDAGHWRLLWIGYDTAEVAVLAFVAWAAWARRQILGAAALVAAVLLICDAWFDIVTSLGHRDQWVTLATGLGAEIPLALFFVWLYRHILLRSLVAYHALAGDDIVISHVHNAPLIAGVEDELPTPAGRGARRQTRGA